MTLSMSQIHWDYLLLLEEDVIQILHYLEPVEENYIAFGPELVKAYLSICSEIDVAFKDLDRLVRKYEATPWSQVKNISGSREMVHDRFSGQFRFSWVTIKGSEFVSNPWSTWWDNEGMGPILNPRWWIAYNNVKHNRLQHYAEANLGNVLHALSGLFVLLSCLYRYEFENDKSVAPSYLQAPRRLTFSEQGIKLGSSEPLYVMDTTIYSSPGFHVDEPLSFPASVE